MTTRDSREYPEDPFLAEQRLLERTRKAAFKEGYRQGREDQRLSVTCIVPGPEDDHDTGFIAMAAVRYALGRQSYAPALIRDWVWRHHASLPASHLRAIAGEVLREATDSVHDAPAWRDWAQRLLAGVESEA